MLKKIVIVQYIMIVNLTTKQVIRMWEIDGVLAILSPEVPKP